ncbi:hypothetical protein I532_17678 [Brevibacillus borstelensis AK1]|jgi:hypothetical protein|uniref:Uncharacterized protein n=1 Tax=Brevibacillus borstelensis AK1 TaxID=1300222 RepID=M8DDE6_9BACL|nr:hypothetical protein I532_17678 [Brevibacillus borstelensis AK1]
MTARDRIAFCFGRNSGSCYARKKPEQMKENKANSHRLWWLFCLKKTEETRGQSKGKGKAIRLICGLFIAA